MRASEDMRLAIRDLEVANAALSRFASVAAHQLRSPPRGIIGAAQVLLEDFTLPKDSLPYIEDIRLDAVLMSQIVDGLHRISDVRRLGEVVLTSVDLNQVFSKISETLQRSGYLNGGRILHVEEGLPSILGDHTLLMEAFTNLIKNGFKFNRSFPAEVWISSHESVEAPPLRVVVVRDNGIGINMAYQHKLFQLFERLSREFPGTGVGLYLSKMLFDRMNGDIEVSSTLGEGTSFSITFPIRD
jgi:signal transduction histidine kinase